jgi:hypothetical protein
MYILKYLKRLFRPNPTTQEIQENLEKRIKEVGIGDCTSSYECIVGGKDNILESEGPIYGFGFEHLPIKKIKSEGKDE